MNWTIASIVGAVILVAAILFWLFRAEQKASHHLDRLHIVPPENPEKKE
jgi:uncharacterized membrane protein YwaF